MNKLLFFLALLLLLLTAGSCNYEPVGSYESDVKSNPNPPIVRVSLNMLKDTLLIMKNQKLEIYFESDSNQIIQAEIKIESYGTFHGKIDSNKKRVTFSINTEDIEKKYSKAVATLILNSSSGSLADKLNMEGFKLTKEWVLQLFNFNDYHCTIYKVELNGGSVLIKWGTNAFSEMVDSVKIQKYTGDGSVWVMKYDKLPSQFEFYDNTYLGERAVYRAFIYFSYAGYRDEAESELYTIPSIRPALNYQFIGKKVRLFWRKLPLQNNISGYTLSTNNKEVWSGSFDDTSTIIDDYSFASYREYFLNPIPKIPFNEYDKNKAKGDYASDTSIYMGEPTPHPRGTIFPTNTDRIVYDDKNLIKFFSVREDKVVETYPTYGYSSFYVSNDGSLVLAIDVMNRKCIINKSIPALPKQTYQLDTLLAGYSYNYVALSNDGKLFIGNYTKLNIYDLVNDKLLLSTKLPGSVNGIFTSPDGTKIGLNYGFNTLAVYKVGQGRLDTLMKGSGEIAGFSDNRYLALNLPSKAQVLDMNNNFSIVFEMPLVGGIKSVDISGPNLLVYDSGLLKAVKFTNGDTYYQVPSAYDKFLLHWDIIYSDNGFIERIK